MNSRATKIRSSEIKENPILVTMSKINAEFYITIVVLKYFIRVTTMTLHYCEFELNFLQIIGLFCLSKVHLVTVVKTDIPTPIVVS